MPPVVTIVQYICASTDCGATWRILPSFLARHLWRSWVTIERAVMPADTPKPADARPIPKATRRRWATRLWASARVLVVLLATSGGLALEGLAIEVGLDATRAELVDAHATVTRASPGARLAPVAELAHRLERGVRLM